MSSSIVAILIFTYFLPGFWGGASQPKPSWLMMNLRNGSDHDDGTQMRMVAMTWLSWRQSQLKADRIRESVGFLAWNVWFSLILGLQHRPWLLLWTKTWQCYRSVPSTLRYQPTRHLQHLIFGNKKTGRHGEFAASPGECQETSKDVRFPIGAICRCKTRNRLIDTKTYLLWHPQAVKTTLW